MARRAAGEAACARQPDDWPLMGDDYLDALSAPRKSRRQAVRPDPEGVCRLAPQLHLVSQAVADLMRGTSVGVREGHERACRAAREVGFLPHIRGNLLETSVPPHPSVHAGMPVVGVFFDRQR